MAAETIDPNDAAARLRRMAELQAELAALQAQDAVGCSKATGIDGNTADTAARTDITTQGGAFVGDSVQVRGGHFIGRDFVQIVIQAGFAGTDADEATSVIAAYLHALAGDLAGLRLGEIDAATDQSKHSPLQLADIYVPLDTTLRIGEEDTLAEWLSRRDRAARKAPDVQQGDVQERAPRPVPALEALAAHRELTVLGKPGSGKSTFGANVLLALAQAWQGHPGELAKLGKHWTHGALLPIRIVLRRFAEQLPPGAAPASAGDLWTFIGNDLAAGAYGLSADATRYVQRIARYRGALVLFDGLDECGNDARRERVLAAVTGFIGSASPVCRFVLTARPYAWPNGPDPERGVYTLDDLNDAQIEQFVRAWYAALVQRDWLSPGEAERKLADLLGARHRPDLRPLATNPLLLTLMAVLHTNRGGLPDDRADLYHESVELLMLRWNRKAGAEKALLDALSIPGLKLADLRDALARLAFEIHAQSVGHDGPADIGESRLVRAFRPLLNGSFDKAAVVVDYIEKRAGLLGSSREGEKDGERQFAFPHRTFQEFLAACRLAARDDFAAECARLARSAPVHWSVVLPLAARVAKAERGASAADELVGGRSVAEFRAQRPPAPDDWTCAMLAGAQLHEIGLAAINASARGQAIADRVRGWLAASLPLHPNDGGLPAAQRAQAGDLLSALGDPRFDPQRFHLPADASLGFARIAADPAFHIGTRRADKERVEKIIGAGVDDDEFNDAPTPTPEFHIARYLVTVAQFRAFVDAAQFQLGDTDALRGPDSRPVRYIDWDEATAYCTWLDDMLRNSPVFADHPATQLVREQGWRIALPSELEWEKAARGGLADAVFSWGDTPDPQRANYDDSGVNGTSAVGCFPANDYDLYDMVGNVREWTRSVYSDYPYAADDPRREPPDPQKFELLVVRDAAWLLYPHTPSSCACRRGLPRATRATFLGFRVVLRSAPVSGSGLS